MTRIKQILSSKTLNFNTLAAAIFTILKSFGVEIPSEVTVAILTVGNYILRFFTKESIKDKGTRKLDVTGVAIFLIVPFLFFGCAAIQTTAPENSVCRQADAECSIICEQVEKRGITVEDLDSLLVDAAAIARLANAYEVKEALDLVDSLILLVQDPGQLTYDMLNRYIDIAEQDSNVWAGILSRRVNWLVGEDVICQFDRELILIHLRNQKQMLLTGLDSLSFYGIS